jgi:threonine dehydrogenase-like Zn-dependent dehydrogenase
MKGLVLEAEWAPRTDYVVSEFEKRTGKAITGSSVWRHPKLQVKKDVPDPRPKADEVVIQVKACGICGSDMHFYETDKDGYMLYPGLTKFPCITGHEFSGKVVEVGKEVKDPKVGDMVTAEEMIWCGYCTPCRNGYPNHCQNLEEIGFTINGAFADYIAVGAKYCWKIDAIAERLGSEDKAYEAGALVEPCSVAYNTIFIRGQGFKPGAYVTVFGAGPIGFGAIALAKAAGAAKVIAFEVSEARRKLAKSIGADYVYDPRAQSPSEVIMELTNGEGADVHIEAAGAPEKTVPEMEKALAINSRILIVGRAARRVPMYLEALQVRRSQVFGSQGHSGDAIFPSVIRLMASGLIDLTPVITARYPLLEAVDGIERLTKREDGKIMVKM